MKRVFTILVAVILTAGVFAQSPDKMSYQAVIRDNGGNLVTDQVIGMRISILQGDIHGASAYIETQNPTTNANDYNVYGIIYEDINIGVEVYTASDDVRQNFKLVLGKAYEHDS